NFHKIGFSFFFFILSIVTSFLATWLSLAHAKRQDTKQSRSTEVAKERDEWLEELRQQMEARHQQEYQQLMNQDDDFNKDQ
ncbi:MAG: hypothetical protein ABEJ25_03150, partial [Candidatus Bipolaricaulia bacterium]